MNHRLLATIILLAAVACGAPSRRTLGAQTAIGPAVGSPGKVLVMSASCGAMESQCRLGWAPAVDSIVVSGLEFHGYATIDPQSLRKDEAQRTETTVTADSRDEHQSESTASSLEIVGIIPIASTGVSSNRSLTVRESREKTVVLVGATIEDLRVEDRQSLMSLAGAESVLTTRIVVGANYSVWTKAQVVEVMIKLSDARDGAMRWSARCAASSADFTSADAAIEGAARCVVDAITRPAGTTPPPS
ncbi:MAG: hypothetical protein H0T42_30015 [Deltaproteobacteria bacterium]|nr:hypothetical protein [Deltaproteobacteria bacterium]